MRDGGDSDDCTSRVSAERLNTIDQGDVLGDRARDFVRGNEMAEPLKGFQQDQKADSHRYAVSQRVGQVEFIRGRGVDFAQLLFGNGVFQSRVGSVVNGRQLAAPHKLWF